MSDKETIWVITADAVEKRKERKARELKIEELTINVGLFLGNIGKILEQSPDRVGKFEFSEFEVHADVTAKGALALLGTGAEAGASGGLKFIFRRSPSPLKGA